MAHKTCFAAVYVNKQLYCRAKIISQHANVFRKFFLTSELCGQERGTCGENCSMRRAICAAAASSMPLPGLCSSVANAHSVLAISCAQHRKHMSMQKSSELPTKQHVRKMSEIIYMGLAEELWRPG